MAFTLSRATPEDIPGMVDIWYNAFHHPVMLDTFPDTPAVRAYVSESFARSMREEKQHTTFMVMAEEQPDGKKRVASWTKWVVEQGGALSDWRHRWGSEMAEGMLEEKVGEGFFVPMARQHSATTRERKHYCRD
jgi:hypothetical protein